MTVEVHCQGRGLGRNLMGELAIAFAAVLLVAGIAGTRPACAAVAGQNSTTAPSEQAKEQKSGTGGQGNCQACHAEVVAQLAAHPHSRGAQQVQCADCHQPHGNPPGRISQSTAEQNATCIRCHSEMAGPFEHEHPPVKVEGCSSCHAPHGTSDANSLILGGVPAVCLQCHEISKASLHPHDISPAGLVRDRSGQYVPCTHCHSHIHGSNLSKVFFK